MTSLVLRVVGGADGQECLHRLYGTFPCSDVQNCAVGARVHGVHVGAAARHQRLYEEGLVELSRAEQRCFRHVAWQGCQSGAECVHIAGVHDSCHIHWQVTEAAVALGRKVMGIHWKGRGRGKRRKCPKAGRGRKGGEAPGGRKERKEGRLFGFPH